MQGEGMRESDRDEQVYPSKARGSDISRDPTYGQVDYTFSRGYEEREMKRDVEKHGRSRSGDKLTFHVMP